MKRGEILLVTGFAMGVVGGVLLGKSADPNGAVAWIGAGLGLIGFFLAFFASELGK